MTNADSFLPFKRNESEPHRLDRLGNVEVREAFWRDVLVNIYTNMAYHQARWRIMSRRENSVKVISLVMASSQAATLQAVMKDEFPIWASALQLATIVLANSWSLSFRWGDKARDSQQRYDAWVRFDAKVQKIGLLDYTESDLAKWKAEMAELILGEAATNERLVSECELEVRKLLRHHIKGQKPTTDLHNSRPWWRRPIFYALN